MFDLTNKHTFINLQTWLEKLSEVTDIQSIYITLIGNKSDLRGKQQVTQEEINTFLYNNNSLHIKYHSCFSLDNEKTKEILKSHLVGIFINRNKIYSGIEYKNPKYIPDKNDKTKNNYDTRYGYKNDIFTNTNTNTNTTTKNPFTCIYKLFKKY